MMRHYSVIILLLVLALSFPLTTEASWQFGLDWSVEEGFAPEAAKLNWWLASRWGVRTVYAWAEEDLSLALVHIPQTRAGFHSYVGLGVRDLLDNSQLQLNEKIELTAGVELRLDRLIPGLATAVEGRLVLTNLVGEPNQLAPFFGLALHYGSTPVTVRTPRGVDNDLYLLAKLIRAEAEGEPYLGQVAVGAVVMNRVKSRQFPNTIYDVIYQPRQFSCLPKLATIEPNADSLRAARDALAGKDPSRGALYYYNPKLASPEGARFFRTANLTPTVIIGDHHFFK